ncbi:hypothetical protein THAOC_32414 [Thalassiosira oceanica]|uniref:Uncharacterized protein n=1 Tax=Thalassiosira oceanica TaxID=159749 RepID=K0RIQ2_THAOC|nr:hypothetical protein THAOC_32414 [Thalassiosira oceanica]|eukprot:EJK48761.1 hypothetical protein THAOC_32414 [Thalassiosira oceanica]
MPLRNVVEEGFCILTLDTLSSLHDETLYCTIEAGTLHRIHNIVLYSLHVGFVGPRNEHLSLAALLRPAVEPRRPAYYPAGRPALPYRRVDLVHAGHAPHRRYLETQLRRHGQGGGRRVLGPGPRGLALVPDVKQFGQEREDQRGCRPSDRTLRDESPGAVEHDGQEIRSDGTCPSKVRAKLPSSAITSLSSDGPLTEHSVESGTTQTRHGVDRELEGAARRRQQGQDDPRDRSAVTGVARGEAPGEIRRPYQVVRRGLGGAGGRGRGKDRGGAGCGVSATRPGQGVRRYRRRRGSSSLPSRVPAPPCSGIMTRSTRCPAFEIKPLDETPPRRAERADGRRAVAKDDEKGQVRECSHLILLNPLALFQSSRIVLSFELKFETVQIVPLCRWYIRPWRGTYIGSMYGQRSPNASRT